MAEPREYDPFAGESGLKDDYDGIIVDAWFATDPKYNNGQTLLVFLKKHDEETGEETEDRYACGPDWGSYDGGETAEHPKGEQKGFNNQTAYYELISTAMEAGGEEEMRRRSSVELGGRGPKAAALWKGLRFHWEIKTETRKIRDRETGEMREITTNRSLPTKFLGIATGDGAGTGSAQRQSGMASPAAANATQSTAGATSAPSTETSQTSPLSGLDPATQAQVKVLAKTKTYPDWVDAVMALTGVLQDATVMAALGDESLYNQLREG